MKKCNFTSFPKPSLSAQLIRQSNGLPTRQGMDVLYGSTLQLLGSLCQESPGHSRPWSCHRRCYQRVLTLAQTETLTQAKIDTTNKTLRAFRCQFMTRVPTLCRDSKQDRVSSYPKAFGVTLRGRLTPVIQGRPRSRVTSRLE